MCDAQAAFYAKPTLSQTSQSQNKNTWDKEPEVVNRVLVRTCDISARPLNGTVAEYAGTLDFNSFLAPALFRTSKDDTHRNGGLAIMSGDAVQVVGESHFTIADSRTKSKPQGTSASTMDILPSAISVTSAAIRITPSKLYDWKHGLKSPFFTGSRPEDRFYFRSGMVVSKRTYLYGKTTVYAKLPAFRGAHPRIYMRPASDSFFRPYTFESIQWGEGRHFSLNGFQDDFLERFNGRKSICMLEPSGIEEKERRCLLNCDRLTTQWPFNSEIELVSLETDTAPPELNKVLGPKHQTADNYQENLLPSPRTDLPEGRHVSAVASLTFALPSWKMFTKLFFLKQKEYEEYIMSRKTNWFNEMDSKYITILNYMAKNLALNVFAKDLLEDCKAFTAQYLNYIHPYHVPLTKDTVTVPHLHSVLGTPERLISFLHNVYTRQWLMKKYEKKTGNAESDQGSPKFAPLSAREYGDGYNVGIAKGKEAEFPLDEAMIEQRYNHVHKFSVDWTPNHLKIYHDDVVVLDFDNQNKGDDGTFKGQDGFLSSKSIVPCVPMRLVAELNIGSLNDIHYPNFPDSNVDDMDKYARGIAEGMTFRPIHKLGDADMEEMDKVKPKDDRMSMYILKVEHEPYHSKGSSTDQVSNGDAKCPGDVFVDVETLQKSVKEMREREKSEASESLRGFYVVSRGVSEIEKPERLGKTYAALRERAEKLRSESGVRDSEILNDLISNIEDLEKDINVEIDRRNKKVNPNGSAHPDTNPLLNFAVPLPHANIFWTLEAKKYEKYRQQEMVGGSHDVHNDSEVTPSRLYCAPLPASPCLDLSRFGCPSTSVVEGTAQKINRLRGKTDWRAMDAKEVLSGQLREQFLGQCHPTSSYSLAYLATTSCITQSPELQYVVSMYNPMCHPSCKVEDKGQELEDY